LLDKIVLCYFVACGVSRLARFNVTAAELSEGSDKVRYFEGTPIPSSVLLVALLTTAAGLGHVRENLWFGQVTFGSVALHPLVIFFAVSGTLMISRVRIPKL
jgi:CDP-diacylglycerol--serine O-phosphatidyltransferase